ncbi:coproporphyrinogen III oxidase [Flavobacteriaceae bacterium]|nr:coproporphyrinogen III oxidase [Flavobacteriaceae bacterium]
MKNKQKTTSEWFLDLRDQICQKFELIEAEYYHNQNTPTKKEINEKNIFFKIKKWQRESGGGGEIATMKGNVFEKVGVNISTVFGKFSDEFRNQIPGTENSPNFWASGISLVAHMKSPLVPAVHMNTRFICTEKTWFGGGADLNPTIENKYDTAAFHDSFRKTCEEYKIGSYDKFKKNCDDYFFIKHRNCSRGVGGIFYDYLNSSDFENDFQFTKNVGLSFLDIFPKMKDRGDIRNNLYSHNHF